MSIEPGKSASLTLQVEPDVRIGPIEKTVTIASNDPGRPLQTLQVRAEVQQDLHEISGFDKRRSIFSEECRSCHADPAAGKTGQALYESLCATCHGSLEVRDHVRSLNAAHVVEEMADLRELIAAGNGRGMPGFSSAEGGPLSDAQIDSLVELFRKWQKSEKGKHGR